MNPTKIVATLGPASESEEMIARLIDVGLDVARLNFSHGTHERHEAVLGRVRRAAEQRGRPLAVLADLCGPKLRLGPIAAGSTIAAGDQCRIVREAVTGDARQFSTNHPAIFDEAAVGQRVLIDDGLIRLRITAQSQDALTCMCEAGGALGTAKGLILPDTELTLPSLTAKDEADVEWAVDCDVDYLALSFVRRADDVIALRERLNIAGANIPVISKIETPQAIDNLDEIIRVSDAILVARGDLGVTTDLTAVPLLQKDMIHRCAVAGRPVIVATQMLQSMVDQPAPTRAEVSDVANAVFDGADAVMLSAETATGKYPAEALAVMNRITQRVADFQVRRSRERGSIDAQGLRIGQSFDPTTAAVARSAANVADDLTADWIAVWCHTGTTATWISKHRPDRAIVGFSSDPKVCRRMALVYGVVPYPVEATRSDVRAMLGEAAQRLGLKPTGNASESLVILVGNPQVTRREPVISIHRLTW